MFNTPTRSKNFPKWHDFVFWFFGFFNFAFCVLNVLSTYIYLFEVIILINLNYNYKINFYNYSLKNVYIYFVQFRKIFKRKLKLLEATVIHFDFFFFIFQKILTRLNKSNTNKAIKIFVQFS